MMKIENWSISDIWTGKLEKPTETNSIVLFGNVYGHPRFPDGFEVHTSRISRIEGTQVRTYSGSLYDLGDPSPEFIAAHPDARERLLAGDFNNVR